MTTNPNVARKRHDQLATAHMSKTLRMEADVELWLEDVETMLINYYLPLLEALAASSDPQDETLYVQLDKQYTARMASLQAARERMTECCAHLVKTIKLPGATQ